MARAMDNNAESNLNPLTDCKYFMRGHCGLDDNCFYRHCREAIEQTKHCTQWPNRCRNMSCPYRHPAINSKPVPVKPTPMQAVLPSQPRQPVARQEAFIAFFWDIENVPIPRGQKPFDIVQRIRQELVEKPGLQEASFSCFCNINSIPQVNQESLHHANVRLVHVPDRKVGAADRQILLELDRFERVHRPPATVVLISGDIDFVGKLSDLRHHAGFTVIVIHNKPAKDELKATVHARYPWETFTEPSQKESFQLTNALHSPDNRQSIITERPTQVRRRSRNRSIRRRDPSPMRLYLSTPQQLVPTTLDMKKYPCPKCRSEFGCAQSLRQHQSMQNHLFDCPVCNERFTSSIGQGQHQKDKNHYVLDYKCTQCNHYFAKVESLIQHQNATGHITPIVQTGHQDGRNFQPTNSPILPKNNYNNNNNDKDDNDTMLIILQAIEAIREHFIRRGLLSL